MQSYYVGLNINQTLETIYCNIYCTHFEQSICIAIFCFWHNQYILQYIVTILIYCIILQYIGVFRLAHRFARKFLIRWSALLDNLI
jgi:hypothetical protein